MDNKETLTVNDFIIERVEQLPPANKRNGQQAWKLLLTAVDGSSMNIIEWNATYAGLTRDDFQPGVKFASLNWVRSQFGSKRDFIGYEGKTRVDVPPAEGPKGPVAVDSTATPFQHKTRFPQESPPNDSLSENARVLETCVSHAFDIGAIALKKIKEHGLDDGLYSSHGGLNERGQQLLLPSYIEKSIAMGISLAIETFRRKS